jgi:hypothetical protein
MPVIPENRRFSPGYSSHQGMMRTYGRLPDNSQSARRRPSRATPITWSPPTKHALGALYAAAAHGLPTLADPGYAGAGIGVHTPFKQPADGRRLCIDRRTYNKLLRSLRCQEERDFALLPGRWRVLQHVTASPNRIGDLANAALVLTQI